METKIIYAKLKFPIFVPKVGQVKETLVADASGPSLDLEMTLIGGVLQMRLKGVTVFIPTSSLTHMVAVN